jgi:hypothetical protein
MKIGVKADSIVVMEIFATKLKRIASINEERTTVFIGSFSNK